MINVMMIYICCLLNFCDQHDNTPMQTELQGWVNGKRFVERLSQISNLVFKDDDDEDKKIKGDDAVDHTDFDWQESPSQNLHNSTPWHPNISSLALATIPEVLSEVVSSNRSSLLKA